MVNGGGKLNKVRSVASWELTNKLIVGINKKPGGINN